MKIKLIILAVSLLVGIMGVNAKNNALLVGIGNYNTATTGWQPISGNNDVDLLEGKLKDKGFSVNTLKDSNATKNNILSSLENLIKSSKAGDVVYIHFSGHSQLVEDMNNDEPDGYDVAFICYDACISPEYNGSPYKGENHLIDDELFPYFNSLKKKVGKKGKIVAVFDTSHTFHLEDGNSQTIANGEAKQNGINPASHLVFSAEGNSNEYLKNITKPGTFNSDGGEIILINACDRNGRNYEKRDKQTGKNYGALSYCIGELFDNNIPMKEWPKFFRNKKYREYKIFRPTQNPGVIVY